MVSQIAKENAATHGDNISGHSLSHSLDDTSEF